ncbi:MHS family MFS transporter [Amycolatopsis rubida]|uniref:MHS family MFS transporter n=1 Tax=Amycolatopsis rubida TaxID=112413 RepID=A0ABX0BZT3_9PSEU|nr:MULTISPECIES: MFS transporter [Amycolatopsis]MYW96104.1 MFS transporter [Amycolatopsis rubida]NEC61095.1 MHS family MFS transporter [Amycolatopsis rubida]OAP23385.1 Inner membrane metabolite transport protein YhjE [Amycolatopsis sp. M39]
MDRQENLLAPDGSAGAGVAHAASAAKNKWRVAFTSSIGNLIEQYDFSIYGVAAALVFPKVFFPGLSSAAGILASFATFGVAFVARPLGGVLFGHLGDRLGRKKTLVATLVLMGVATTLIGVLPPASVLGAAAPIALIVLRVAQGLAAGGEWAGANLFAAEHAPVDERGRWAMFPQLGSAISFSLGNATFLLTGVGMSDEAFRTWGWRVPFIASALLVAIGLYIRLQIEETPVFRRAVADDGVLRTPFVEALKRQPRQILVGCGLGLMMGSFYYISATYLTSYASADLHLSRTAVLLAGMIGGLFVLFGALASGLLSDRIGRRTLLVGANATGVVWSLALFPILSLGGVFVFAICLCVTLFLSGFVSSPLGAFLPEQFRTRYRYTASAISYNMGALLGGSIPPLVAPALVGAFSPIALGAFLALYALIATACTRALKDGRKSSLSEV